MSSTNSVCRSRVLLAQGLELYRSNRQAYKVYFIPSDMCLEDVAASRHGDFLTAGSTAGADWKAVRVLETYEQVGDNGES